MCTRLYPFYKVRWVCIVLASLIVFVFIRPVISAERLSPADAVQTIAQQKFSAEEWARQLKVKYAPGDQAYVSGERLYSNAQIDFNALVQSLKARLAIKEPIDKSRSFHAQLEAAVAMSQIFIRFAQSSIDEKVPITSPQAVSMIFPAIITAVTSATISIWEAYQKAKQVERDKIVAQLNELTWQSFGQIK